MDGCWRQVQRSPTVWPSPKLPSATVPQPGAQLVFATDPVLSATLSHSECTFWWRHSRVWRADRAATAGESKCWCKGQKSPCFQEPDLRCSRCLLWRRSSHPGSQRWKDRDRSEKSGKTSGGGAICVSVGMEEPRWSQPGRLVSFQRASPAVLNAKLSHLSADCRLLLTVWTREA